MDARQLSMLRELGELGSVQAVAKALHVTPSAVSQQLKLLQRAIPVPLTERSGRALVLTDAGRALAAAAADVHSALVRAGDVARGLAHQATGTVTVSAFNSAASAFFPRLSVAFPQDGPLRVRLTDEDVAQADFPRLTAQCDIVLAHRLDHTSRWPATVRVTPLLHEPLDVALPLGHRLASATVVTPDAIAGERWITTHDGFPVIASMDAIAAAAGRPITITHRINEFSVAAELVRAGAGLALIPRWTAPRPTGVVLRPLGGVRAARHVDALHRPEKSRRAGTRAVLAQLREIAADLAGR